MDERGKTKRKADADSVIGKRPQKKNKSKFMDFSRRKSVQTSTMEPGDAGVWVSCVRGMEARAEAELQKLFDEYVQLLYGVKPQFDECDSDSEGNGDIESSVQKELDTMKTNASKVQEHVVAPVRLNMECLLFYKLKPPIQPDELVRKICLDACEISSIMDRKTKYVNRFTPIFKIVRASVDDLIKLAKEILPAHFTMRKADAEEQGQGTAETEGPFCTYAIRETIRNHDTITRDDILKRIPELVDARHTVNLTKPGKTILVNVFRSYCGISVVQEDWTDLKKYNVNELYIQAAKNAKKKASDEKK